MSTIQTIDNELPSTARPKINNNFSNLNTDKVEGPSVSVDSEVALFSGAGGKTITRASGSGIAKLISGVLSLITAPSGALVGDTDPQTLTNKTIGDTLKVKSSAGAANFALDISSETTLSIANNTTATPFGGTNNFAGMFVITGSSGSDQTAIFITSGGVMKLVSQTNADFTVTSGTASKINVYLSASVVTIENKLGGTLTCRVIAFKTKSSN